MKSALARSCVAATWLSLGAWVAIAIAPPVAEAQCINNPGITLSSITGAPGTIITVTGEGFMDQCSDLVAYGQPLPPSNPLKGIKIFFNQGDRKQLIGTTDANANFQISIRIAVPENATVGPASFTVEASRTGTPVRPAPFSVTAK